MKLSVSFGSYIKKNLQKQLQIITTNLVRIQIISEDKFLPGYEDINADNVMDILHTEIGKVFSQVLEDAGVYKRDEAGQKAFMRFINSL